MVKILGLSHKKKKLPLILVEYQYQNKLLCNFVINFLVLVKQKEY